MLNVTSNKTDGERDYERLDDLFSEFSDENIHFPEYAVEELFSEFSYEDIIFPEYSPEELDELFNASDKPKEKQRN